MASLMVKMAQRAAKDPSLMASLIDRYCTAENLQWKDIADTLWIDHDRLAKLALCRRPQETNFSKDIVQIADYVGIEKEKLVRFVRKLEAATVERPQVTTKKKVVRKQRRGFSLPFVSQRPVWAFAAAAIILILASTFILLLSGPDVATLAVQDGQATVFKQGNVISSIFRPNGQAIALGSIVAVTEGDVITLDGDAQAQLKLADGSTVDLSENVDLHLENLEISQDTYQVRLRLKSGKAVSRVNRLPSPDASFEVVTPSATVAVRGTVFTVKVISPTETYVSCDEGSVYVGMDGRKVEVQAGEEVTAVVGQAMEVQPRADWEGPPTPELNTEASPPGTAEPPAEGTTTAGEATQAPSDGGSPGDGQEPPLPGEELPPGEEPPPSGENPPPGQGGEPPGQGGEPPGQGIPPGKDKDKNR